MVAEHLPVEEVTDIKQMFHTMDINKKGKLTLDELKNGLNLIGHHMPDKDIDMLMEAVRGSFDACNLFHVTVLLPFCPCSSDSEEIYTYFSLCRQT